MSHDDLGDRMKSYESVEIDRKFDPSLPVYARIDGRSFSKFTKSFTKPFDNTLSNAFQFVTASVMQKTNACFGYTQSDEISLVYAPVNYPEQLMFDGKIHKFTSVLASLTTSIFQWYIITYLSDPEYLMDQYPHFDARVINLPSESEAANMILWRSNDAAKNSISSAARSIFSHKQMQNKNSQELRNMMLDSGFDYNLWIPDHFKYGVYLQKTKSDKILSEEELNAIPEKYRPPYDLNVERSIIKKLNIMRFSGISNRVDVVFSGCEPKVLI